MGVSYGDATPRRGWVMFSFLYDFEDSKGEKENIKIMVKKT